jgi:putative Mg2+ transporter-C (MgtC) family protein
VPGDLELLMRVGVGAALGAALGVEREHRGQVAGMRTHALVACGAAIFTIAGAYGFSDVHRGPNVDPMRVAAQVASGIGFIGGGVILKAGASVRGVTTAASLWAAAAIGLATGAGLLALATGGVAIVLAMLIGLRWARERLGARLGGAPRIVTVSYQRGHGTLGPLLETLRDVGANVEDLAIDDRNSNGSELREVRLMVRAADPHGLQRAVAEIGSFDEVHVSEIETAPS